MRDPYEVLGVAKNATPKDIKSAFRKLAKQYHPDQNPDDPKAKDKFSAANQAYEILGDEKSRAAYDRGEIDGDGKPKFQGFENAGFGGGGDPFAGFRQRGGAQGPGGAHYEFRSGGGSPFGEGDDDVFSHLFGDAMRGGGMGGAGMGGRGRPQKGEDLNASLDVSLEDVATAARVEVVFPDGVKLAIKLPHFVEDGQVIRLKGKGEAGPAGPGDALIKIKIRKSARYRIEGRDLHVDLPVELRAAVLGEKVPVETPSGKIAITVPAWSSSDKVLRLKGKGLPVKTGGHADLYVHVRVMLPENHDPELEALLRSR